MTPVALVLAAVVAMQEQAPPPALDADPAPPIAAPTPDATTPPVPDPCLVLLRAGKDADAQACWQARADGDGGDAKLARELADLVVTLRLHEPQALGHAPIIAKPIAEQAPTPRGFLAFGEVVSSGKAEMIGVSTLAGAYLGLLGTATLFSAAGDSFGTPGAALVLLSPVLGGSIGLVGSTSAVLLLPAMTAGDANIIRASLLLGGFNSIMLPIDASLASNNMGQTFSAQITFLMGAVVIAGGGVGAALAGATDLPESAGSLALSTGLWTTVVCLLGADMMQTFKTNPENFAWLATATGNVGFVGGIVLSQYVPVSRAETWAIDVGGGVGLLAGASIATFAHAPNPFMGWGTMLVGTSVGIAGGFAAARYLPDAFGALPEFIAVAPMAMPDPSDATGRRVAWGGAMLGRF